MNISVRNIVPVILLTCSSVFSQNYLPMFSEYIPQSVLKDEDFKNQIEVNIEYYASVNPDLVYYYIMYISKRFGDKVTNPDSNYYNLLKQEDFKFRSSRNEWVNDEISAANNIDPGILSSAVKRNLLELYQDGLNNQINAPELQIDNNLLNYFSYMIASNTKIIYQDNIDYSNKTNQVLNAKAKYFQQMYSDYNSLTKSQRYELIDVVLNFPYLFSKGYLNRYRQNTDLHLYEFINKMLYNDYIQKNSVKAGIFYLLNNFDQIRDINFRETPFPYYHRENKAEFKITTGIFGDIGVRIALRNYKTPFSYIEVNAGYALTSNVRTEDDIQTEVIHWDSYQPSTGKHAFITYTVTENNENKFFEIYGNITTPVFYFFQNLYVDAGLNYYYTSVKSNYYDISRHIDSLVSNDPNDFKEYTQNISGEFSKSNIYPSIGINYLIFDLINIKVEYLIPALLTAKAAIIYNF
jgi:hypothetical protein